MYRDDKSSHENESFQDKLKLLFSFVFVDAAVINALFAWYTYMDINE